MTTSSYDAAVSGAVRYLESHLSNSSVSLDPYALSIITYALTLAESSLADSALQKLNSLAINEGLTLSLHRCRRLTRIIND